MEYKRGTFIANASQSAAITHKLAPLMIIAGAGTGKTTTLLHRIYYLIEHYNLNPENILTITYTERAAKELKTRIVKNIGDTANAMTISTFHAFCYNIVKENRYNGNSTPILMDDGDAIYLFLQRFDELGPFESRMFIIDPVKSITKSFIPFINRLRDELVDPNAKPNPLIEEEVTEETIAQLNDLKRIYPFYQKWKKEQNFVDFGDMILQCYELLKSDKSVLQNVQDQYKYIIIDEFQDNNYALNEVVSLIVSKIGQLTVVGDEDQIVYSFRGASRYNILSFREKYHNHKNYAEISLKENFRSTQQILDVANDSISNAKERNHKYLVAFGGKTGAKPQLIQSDNKNHPNLIAEEIQSLSNRIDYSDIAVLCRTKAQVKAISKELSSVHIPTRTYLVKYFEIQEIRDLLAWCYIVSETKEQDSSFFRLISRYIDENFANKLFNKYSNRDHTPRFELIQQSGVEGIGVLIEKVNELRRLDDKKNASEMVWEIIHISGLMRPLVDSYEWQDQLALLNIGVFLSRVQDFTSRHKANNSLVSFANYMNVLQEVDGIQTTYPIEHHQPPAVLVNTIHGVKGAEFPVVFIPFNRSASFPLNFMKSDLIDFPPNEWLSNNNIEHMTPKELHIEEERRLFYVGLTRTKELLYLYAPSKATSVFIKEINKDLLQVSEMLEQAHTNHITKFSELRNRYEKRLTNALNQNQFDNIQDIIRAIKTIHLLENNQDVRLGNSEWEIALQKRLENPLEHSIPDQLYLSASAIETYDQCPLKYRLSNIDKIPQIGSKPQLTFGNIIHKVLEQFHKPNSEQSKERLLNLLKSNWESLGFDYKTQEADFKRQGEEILSNYFEYLMENPTDVVEREFQFTFEIEDIIINGKIDRIDHGQNGYKVVDYKTSKKATKAENSVQLAIYSLYLQQEKNEVFSGIPESTMLHFLREDEPIREHNFSLEELEKMKERIVETGKNIRNQKFETCKGFHCSWCDYKNLLCPEWEEDI